MVPDAPREQPQGPANLPAMPAQPQAIPATPLSPAAPAPVAGGVPMDVIVQAEQLAIRYAQDPRQLAESFGQLKAGYLQQYHHITANPTGN